MTVLSTEATSGLDDHPETVLSPVIMYHIKIAKDEARRQKRKQALMVEGMTDEEERPGRRRGRSKGGGLPSCAPIRLPRPSSPHLQSWGARGGSTAELLRSSGPWPWHGRGE